MARNKREVGEINAGSMADIAFLLLIFYLVTSTIESEEGILRMLPPMEEVVDPPEVKERNVFVVNVNRYDDLLVEGELLTVSDLKDRAVEFMTNPNNSDNLPVKRFISKDLCEKNIAAAKQAKNKEGIAKWEKKLSAVELVGDFWEEPNAVISLQNDRGTSYGVYLEVQDQLQEAVNELRNNMSMKAFNIPFSELDDEIEEDKDRIRAIREAVPQRISEAEPKDVQTIE